jgi:hypothetical protein
LNEYRLPLFYSFDSRSFLIGTETSALEGMQPKLTRKRDGKKVTNEAPCLGETYLLEMVKIEPLKGKEKISDDENSEDDCFQCNRDVALLRKDVPKVNNSVLNRKKTSY